MCQKQEMRLLKTRGEVEGPQATGLRTREALDRGRQRGCCACRPNLLPASIWQPCAENPTRNSGLGTGSQRGLVEMGNEGLDQAMLMRLRLCSVWCANGMVCVGRCPT